MNITGNIMRLLFFLAWLFSFHLLFAQEFTLGTIPDTQVLTENDTNAIKLTEMTQWFVDHKDSLNINFVASLGDMTQWGSEEQWQRIRKSYNVIKSAGIPYAPCQGNHDENLSTFNKYFPESEFQNSSTFGGNLNGGMENAYYLFTEAGIDFIIVVIQTHDQFIGHYNIESIDWANNILNQYPTRKAIFITHDFYENRDLIDDVIKKHDNLFLALCGHSCDREHYWTETSPSGYKVHCVMADYQCDPDGGSTIRYYTFKPTKNIVEAYTYSITESKYEVNENSQFSFKTEFETTNKPLIQNVFNSPLYAKSTDSETITAIITDKDTVTEAILIWETNANGLKDSTTMVAEGFNYSAEIPAYENGTMVYFSIAAKNKNDSTSSSGIFKYAVEDDVTKLPCPFNTSQHAFENKIISLPGLVEIENYNNGCQHVAYYDKENTNLGGEYRNDGVDIEKCTEGGYNLMFVSNDEWLNYDVNITETENYSFEFRVASDKEGAKIHLDIDGVNITGPVHISNTGGWQEWTSAIVNDIHLSAGVQTIKLVVDEGGVNINYFEASITSK
jgi:hypothetical protein